MQWQRTLFSGEKVMGKWASPWEEAWPEKDLVSPYVMTEYSKRSFGLKPLRLIRQSRIFCLENSKDIFLPEGSEASMTEGRFLPPRQICPSFELLIHSSAKEVKEVEEIKNMSKQIIVCIVWNPSIWRYESKEAILL